MGRLTGSIACVTGASSGIGEATAFRLAEAGANIIAVARRADRLATLQERLQTSFGIEVLPIVCDVRNKDDVYSFVAALPDSWSAIDILINNAGLSRGLDPLHQGVVQDWEEMIDTNIKGLLYVSRALMPGMVARNKGTIINIASIAGRQVYPNGNVYCATKSAVKALSEAMTIETAHTNVRICNIDPGLVETEFSEVRFHGDSERAQTVYKGYQPLKGEDIADLIEFCVTRPPHVVLNDILILPKAQGNTYVVHKQQ